MKSVEFCYWMQGMFELTDPKTLNEKQVELIKAHLNMVFLHEIDPSYPPEQQKPLQDLHDAPQFRQRRRGDVRVVSNGKESPTRTLLKC
jgi:hypothetical protein